MDLLKLITDDYERKARFYPSVVLVFPIGLTIPIALSIPLLSVESVIGGVMTFGGAFFLAQFARDFGKKLEQALFDEWGGIPSATIFRHRDDRLDAITKRRFHKKLTKLVKGTKIPGLVMEKRRSLDADKTYIAWSNYLRFRTRDIGKYALLFQENVSYGYRRNLLGLRNYGVLSTLGCIISLLIVGCFKGTFKYDLLMVLGIDTLFLGIWIFQITKDWVRVPALAYAERLAETIEIL